MLKVDQMGTRRRKNYNEKSNRYTKLGILMEKSIQERLDCLIKKWLEEEHLVPA